MTTKQRCEVAMLAYTFIDTTTQEGVDKISEMLDSLSITLDDFKAFLSQLPRNENTRFTVYNDIRRFSEEEKGIVRSTIYKAFSEGGKQGTEYALFYFKEMINECDLANARIQI